MLTIDSKVVTRSGLPARIICDNRTGYSEYTIIALYYKDGVEHTLSSTSEGKAISNPDLDLVEIPKLNPNISYLGNKSFLNMGHSLKRIDSASKCYDFPVLELDINQETGDIKLVEIHNLYE